MEKGGRDLGFRRRILEVVLAPRRAADREKNAMSLDPSLKSKGNLAGKRSVLTRAERVAKLATDKKIDVRKQGALGLRKTISR